MRNRTRRSLLKPGVGITPGLSTGGASDAVIDDGTSRRAFLQGTAGAAAGAAAFLVIPRAATLVLDQHGTTAGYPKAVPTQRTGPAPAEPVTAYVHNPARHEVVVMWGQNETTFKDPALVQRLLDATR